MEQFKKFIDMAIVAFKTIYPYIVQFLKLSRKLVRYAIRLIKGTIPYILSLFHWIMRRIKGIITLIILLAVFASMFFGFLLFSSKQSAYKSSDFSIDSEMFTIKTPKDTKNAYKDFVSFLKGLEGQDSKGGDNIKKRIDFSYLGILYDCKLNNSSCSNDSEVNHRMYFLDSNPNISDTEFDNYQVKSKEQFKRKVVFDLKQLKNITSSRYFSSGRQDVSEDLYNYLVNYTKSVGYIAIEYIDEGKVDSGLEILGQYQNFLNYLYKNAIVSKKGFAHITSAQSIHLDTFLTIVENGKLNEKQKRTIYSYFSSLNPDALLKNTLKQDYHIVKEKIETIKREGISNTFPGDYKVGFTDIENTYLKKAQDYMLINLFYSDKETKLLLEKIYADFIEEGSSSLLDGLPDSITVENMGNFIGKMILKNIFSENKLFAKNTEINDKKSQLLTSITLK